LEIEEMTLQMQQAVHQTTDRKRTANKVKQT